MSPYTVIVIGFAAIFAVMLVAEVLSRAGSERFRPAGQALHAALAHPVGRWVTMACWLWLGLHFLAR